MRQDVLFLSIVELRLRKKQFLKEDKMNDKQLLRRFRAIFEYAKAIAGSDAVSEP